MNFSSKNRDYFLFAKSGCGCYVKKKETQEQLFFVNFARFSKKVFFRMSQNEMLTLARCFQEINKIYFNTSHYTNIFLISKFRWTNMSILLFFDEITASNFKLV